MTCKKIIVVLGMHRSGTSALTRGLSVLGVGLGDTLYPAGEDNPTGFWEDTDVIALNNKLLAMLGSSYDRVGLMDVNFDNSAFEEIVAEAKNLIVAKTADIEVWGIKDPRIPRLLGFWKRVFSELEIAVGYVIALRNPMNVAESLLRRNKFPPSKSYFLWLEHMLQSVALTHSETRLVVSYDNLLQDPGKELSRISDTLELPAAEKSDLAFYINDFLNPELRHGQKTESDLRNARLEPPFLADVYALLNTCAQGRLPINSPRFEECFRPLVSGLKRYEPLLKWIAATEQTIEAQNVHMAGLSGGLQNNNEVIATLTGRLHEANLDLIALRAQVASVVEEKEISEGPVAASITQLRAEKDGFETLAGSLRFESDKAAAAFKEMLEQKDQELSGLRSQVAELTNEKMHASVKNEAEVTTVLKEENRNLRLKIFDLKDRQKQSRRDYDTVLSARDAATAQIDELNVTLSNVQQLVAETQEHNRAIQHQRDALLIDLNIARHHQALLNEKTLMLSDTWRTLFNSKKWKVLSTLARNSSFPPITLPNGEQFDPDFYLEANPDVAAAGLAATVHYLTNGINESRVVSPHYADGRVAAYSDASATTHLNVPAEVLAVLEATGHDVTLTSAPQPPRNSEFDADFYSMLYPDILEAGQDPERHFYEHGRAEGRVGSIPILNLSRDLSTFPEDRPTVLFVSHEASRTGAPILSLNIVQHLVERFNVVVLLLGGGALETALLNTGAIIAGPVILHRHEIAADWALGKFFADHTFDFAIVNSIESQLALKPLAKHYIPSISLIHEFAAYTRPKSTVNNALLWASQTVFSASVTLDSAKTAIPELDVNALKIMPQGKSVVPSEHRSAEWLNAEMDSLRQTMRPEGFPEDGIVILGAGWVQIRKGVDLFIECANRVLNSPIGHKCRFVWVGNNFDPEKDVQYSVYLQDQIQRSNISDRFSFITETEAIEHVYTLSDMLLISSRLDPLPNVAIDAMVHGLPVLCFDKTTGIADVLARHGLAEFCVAPYLDTHTLADKISRIASSPELKEEISKKIRTVAGLEFNMAKYVDDLVLLAQEESLNVRQEFVDVATILQAKVADVDFYHTAAFGPKDEEGSVRRYVRSWKRGIMRRKLFPGFEPGLYQELNQESMGTQDALAHFLRAGSPSGPWLTEKLSWDVTAAEPAMSKTLAFVTVHDAEEARSITNLFDQHRLSVDVVLLTESETLGAELEQAFKSEHFPCPPVLTSTVGPMTDLLARLEAFHYQDYSVIGHINLAPRDRQSPDADYQRYVVENMVGGVHESLEAIVASLTDDACEHNYGLIFPDCPEVNYSEEVETGLAELCEMLGMSAPRCKRDIYPTNFSFWCHPNIIEKLLMRTHLWKPAISSLKLTPETQERVIARLVSQACLSSGKNIATTAVSGFTY